MTSPAPLPTSSRPVSPGALAMVSTLLLWSAAFPAIALGLHGFDAVPLAALRFAIAAVVLLALWARGDRRWPGAADLLRFIACGAIGIALYNALLNHGQRSVAPGAASFIVNAQPLVAALLGGWWLGERRGGRLWAGTALGLTGIAVIGQAQPGGLQWGEGTSLVALAAVCSGTSFVLQRPLVARYGALGSATFTLTAGALLLSPWLPAALSQWPEAPAASSAAVVFLGLGPAALGFLCWMRALDRFGATRASHCLYLMPPLATAMDWAASGRTPSLAMLLGGATVVAGVAVVHVRVGESTRPPIDDRP